MCLIFFFCLCNRQLDNFSLPVFKENVRLKESLKYHIEQAEDLKKRMNSLVQKNASLTQDKVCMNYWTANSIGT